MLSGWLGIYKEEMKKPEEEKKPEEITKSSTFQVFLSHAETQKFVNEWNTRIMKTTGKTGRALVTGILDLAYNHPGVKTDEGVRKAAHRVLDRFAGEGRLDVIAGGLKAAPERILKEIKTMLGFGEKKAA